MSQHSSASVTANSTTTVCTQESSAKAEFSETGSLKEFNNKDGEVPLTDDFVLLSTPDKFKDKNINEINVVKRHRADSSPNDKINLECLLLADTSEQLGAPQHVQVLFEHYDSNQLSQPEILFLLVYTVALESGFVSNSEYEQAKFYIEHLSSTNSFHAKNILRLSRLKPSYKTTADKTRFILQIRTLINVECASSDYLCALLIGFVTGDLLIVTLSPANSTGAKGYSTSLSIDRYVLSMHARNKPLYKRFQKVNELSSILRNELFAPMRCQHLRWLQCSTCPTLDCLPAELYDDIFKYLSKNQLNILANVNKSLYGLVKSIISKKPSQSKVSLENVIETL